MRETPFLQRAILRWPVVTFAMPGVVISELEAVIRELESVFLIFLNNYSYVANRRHMHGTNKGNAGGCKKNGVMRPYFSFYAYLYTRTGIWQSIC